MFGSYTIYELFEIDASDIWSYELTRFNNSNQSDKNKQLIVSIYSSIQIFFFQAKCKPVIKLRDVDSGKIQYSYYKNNFDRASDVNKGIADQMFIVHNDIYSLTTPCIVRKNELNTLDFEKLFALKLSQYHDGLSFLDGFLNFQLGANFEGTTSDFTRFLNNILEQYEDLIDEKIKAKVIKWTEAKVELSNLIKDSSDSNQIDDLSSQSEETESSTIISESNLVNTNETNNLTEKPIMLPAGFKQITCEASKEEILNYFMILSKEKNYLNDKCYMEEKEVEEFVKNNFSGFESTPSGKCFSINLFPNQNNTLIYFIYQFYLKYDRKLANMKMKYVMLLIHNFDLFINAKPETVRSNMSESKKPKITKNIISTKQYLLPK